MKIPVYYLLLLIILVIQSCCDCTSPTSAKLEWIKGEYIVQIDSTLNADEVANLLSELRSIIESSSDTIDQVDIEIDTCMCDLFIHTIKVKVNGEGEDVVMSAVEDEPSFEGEDVVMAAVEDEPEFEGFLSFEKNYRFRFSPLSYAQSDTMKNSRRFNFGLLDSMLLPYEGKKTLVATVDGGMNPAVLEYFIKNNMIWRNPNPSSDDNCLESDIMGWNFGENSYDVTDDMGHGTIVTKLINDHYTGSLPIKNMILKIDDDEGYTDIFKAVCALRYAMDKKVDYINTSWGMYANSGLLNSTMALLENANIKVVSSAGNSKFNLDEQIHLPSNFSFEYSNVLSVAGLSFAKDRLWNHLDCRPIGTNFSVLKNNLAEQAQITVSFDAEANYFEGLSDVGVPDELMGVYNVEGTSFSTPIVTGKVASDIDLWESMRAKMDETTLVKKPSDLFRTSSCEDIIIYSP